jgi:hypothetical protein
MFDELGAGSGYGLTNEISGLWPDIMLTPEKCH